MLLDGILWEFKAIDRDTTRVVTEAFCEARQAASQATNPLLPNPMLPSQSVNPWNSGFIHPNSIQGAIRCLHRQDVFHQVPAMIQAAEPRIKEIPDYGKCLSLPPGEPEQD